MELSPIYEALKRCLYPTIGPLIYTNYRGFNARMHEEREREREGSNCKRVSPVYTRLCVYHGTRGIFELPIVRWLTLFQRFRAPPGYVEANCPILFELIPLYVRLMILFVLDY